MSLTSRIAVARRSSSPDDPEDIFGSSLGIVFPDDVTNAHGNASDGLVYSSPHDPVKEDDRKLFGHYLWNSSLQLAELVEAGTLGIPLDRTIGGGLGGDDRDTYEVSNFTVKDLSSVELGAGTALPSLIAALLGARKVVITDYPSPTLLDTLRQNVAANVETELQSPHPDQEETTPTVVVEGHAWGDLDTDFALRHRHAFDRVFVCDCLWMPRRHDDLQRSIAWFLKQTADGEEGDSGRDEGKAWVIGGFHTGRDVIRDFFDADTLAGRGLEVERLWERDCNGVERPWSEDRGIEDLTERKRWLVISVLRRRKEKKTIVSEVVEPS